MPLGSGVSAGLCGGRAHRTGKIGTRINRRESLPIEQDQPAYGSGIEGPSLRQVCPRHGVLGYSRAGARQPVCNLLGGRYEDDFILYRAISQQSPEQMAENAAGYRAEGYRRFQLKVGSDPDTDVQRIRAVADVMQPGDVLVADANTGWLMHEAAKVLRQVHDVDVYIEQPCLSYKECLSIRRRTNHPFVLDESIDGIDMLLRGHNDDAMDAVNIKISKFGGLTKAAQARDLCVSLGIAMTIEDSWGGDIVTAAIAHLAHSTPAEMLYTSTDFNSYVTVSIASGAPQRKGGRMADISDVALFLKSQFVVLKNLVSFW